MFVVFPLIEHIVALLRLADGVEHVGIALAVQRFLEDLDGEAEIHLVGGDVAGNIWQIRCLDAVEEDQEAQDLVVGAAFCRRQERIILDVGVHVDLFRHPEIVHRLTIPAADPLILHVVEIVEVGGVAADDATGIHAHVAIGIKERTFFHLLHVSFSFLRLSSFRIPLPPGSLSGCSRGF